MHTLSSLKTLPSTRSQLTHKQPRQASVGLLGHFGTLHPRGGTVGAHRQHSRRLTAGSDKRNRNSNGPLMACGRADWSISMHERNHTMDGRPLDHPAAAPLLARSWRGNNRQQGEGTKCRAKCNKWSRQPSRLAMRKKLKCHKKI